MRTVALILAIAFLSWSPSLAGPNHELTLTVHGNVEGFGSHDGDPCGWPLPETCRETVPGMAQTDNNGIEWFRVLAARDQPLAFSDIVFGLGDYNPSECYIGYYGPCQGYLSPLEIPSAGWPGPNSGTSISWAPNCLEGDLVPVYYFGVYVYSPGIIPLGDFHPSLPAAVRSCDDPPVEDPIAGFGSFGCGGLLGEQVCGILPGACCDAKGNCQVLPEVDCLAQGGAWVEDASCDPSPCAVGGCCFDEFCAQLTESDCAEQGGAWFEIGCWPENPCVASSAPDPDDGVTRRTSWGRIKNLYR